MSSCGHVYWITGLTGSGKTTLGTRLYYILKKESPQTVLLDGDIIKELFEPVEVNYTTEGRKKRAFQYSDLCKTLVFQGITVICCTLAMYDDVRSWNRQNIPNYHEIYIDVDWETVSKRDEKGLYKTNRGKMVGATPDTELPKSPDVIIRNTMDDNIDQYVDEIISCIAKKQTVESSYWDHYYKSSSVQKEPSDFARFSITYMQPDRKLIDLGCGNGRDSIFFCTNGLKVTAIDSSRDAIEIVNTASMPIFSVCDDFVATKALFCVDYDYCYARWSIHAINQNQQNELLPNVYRSLKIGGLFFLETRTINDNKFGKGEQLGVNEFFNDGHYRRFADPELLRRQIEDIGFKIVYFNESDRFSVVGEDRPTLLRVIAKKE